MATIVDIEKCDDCHQAVPAEILMHSGLPCADCHTLTGPAPDEVWDAVVEARTLSALVMVDQACVDKIQERLSAAIVDAPLPPVVALTSLDDDTPPAATSSRTARRLLGLARGAAP